MASQGSSRTALHVLLFVVPFLCTLSKAATPTELWSQRYDGPLTSADDEAYRVVRDNNGDLIVFGITSDFNFSTDLLTVKYSGVDGSVLWSRRYDGLDKLDERIGALAVDNAGNVLVTGSSGRTAGGWEIYTAKYAAADGTALWEKSYSGNGNREDHPVSLRVDSTGNVVLAARLFQTNRYDVYLAKYAGADGSLLWDRQHNSGVDRANLEPRAMVLDPSSDLLVTGSSDLDIYTARYSGTDGTLIWEKRYGSPLHDEGLSVTLDGTGNVVIAGRSYNNFSYDIYMAKYALGDGAVQWETRYNGPENGDDIPAGIIADAAGNILLGGSSATNLYIARYRSSDGGLLWERKVEGHDSYFHQVNSLALDAAGDVVLVGSLTNQYAVKLAGATGAIIWEKRSGPAAVGALTDVVIDDQGDAVVTGDLANDFYTARYAAADGEVRWDVSYNGSARGVDIPVTTAIDPGGNVVVFGSSNQDFHTVKYEGTGSGRVLWERRYDGPDSLGDSPAAMILDASGNVIVAGSTQFQMPGIRPSAIYLAKYAASSGAVLWEKRITRSAIPVSAGVAGLVLDESGHIVITASMSDVPIGQDIYTAKLSAADGTLLWEKIYAGPTFDYAHGLILDPADNPIVFGASLNSSGKFDPYIARYFSANGALLWEQRLTNTLRLDFAGTDPNGNVIAAGKSGIQFFGNFVAKFDITTGGLLWERRSTNISGANGFKVAPSGNFYMTALTRTNVPNDIPPYYFPDSLNSIVVQKYSGDGGLLWETKYATTTNIQSFVSTIVLDSSENVIVTGGSRKSDGKPRDSFISKFSGADGSLLWELQRPEYVPSALALNAQGALAIAGNSTVDYLSILYRDDLPPVLTASRNGGNLLHLSWPVAYTGWRLETQSEPSGIRPTGNWTPVLIPSGTNAFTLPLDASKASSFFRLAQP